jgi:hypothetical protein
MHNTPQENESFRKAWDATNARWKAQQKAHEQQQKKSEKTCLL